MTKVELGEIAETQDELQTLLELVFLGEYAVNACRAPKEVSRRHRDMAYRLYRAAYEAEKHVSDPEAIEQNELDDFRDQIYDGVQEYLEQFETDVCLDKLAELLARQIPAEGDEQEQFLKRGIAEEHIRRILQEKGISVVRAEFPGLEEQVADEWNRRSR